MLDLPHSPIPVTVLTGFLGSGKTTLLNRLLTEQHGKRIAVIENEFGEVGVDHQLVIQSDEELFEMNNGCICCTVRGDLIRILSRLAKRKDRLDAILIETTGLADPGPVAQTFFTDQDVREHYRLDGIVTLVDAKHVGQHLENAPEAKEQIAFADVILLNKTDLVTGPELQALEERLRRMNAAAKLYRTQQAAIPLAHVLGLGGFNLGRALEIDPQFLEPEYPFEWGGVFALPEEGAVWSLAKGPDPTMDVVVMPVRSLGAEDLAAAREAAVLVFSDEAVAVSGGDGLFPGARRHQLVLPNERQEFSIQTGDTGLYAFFTQHHPDEFFGWLKLRGHEEVLAPLQETIYKPDHEHDDEVSSVGLRVDGNVDPKRLNEWLSELLRTQGNDIFRSKGVLSVQGSTRRLVFQGVHMLFDGRFDREWRSGEKRENTLVFIGRQLDRRSLQEGFRRCLV